MQYAILSRDEASDDSSSSVEEENLDDDRPLFSLDRERPSVDLGNINSWIDESDS